MLPAVTMEGGLVFEPDVRISARGTPWVRLRLACERERRGPDGVWTKDGDPCFVTVVCWGQMAEALVSSVRIGDMVLVHGVLDQRKWEADDGTPKVDYEVKADVVAVSTRFTDAPTRRARESAVPAPTGEEVPF